MGTWLGFLPGTTATRGGGSAGGSRAPGRGPREGRDGREQATAGETGYGPPSRGGRRTRPHAFGVSRGELGKGQETRKTGLFRQKIQTCGGTQQPSNVPPAAGTSTRSLARWRPPGLLPVWGRLRLTRQLAPEPRGGVGHRPSARLETQVPLLTPRSSVVPRCPLWKPRPVDARGPDVKHTRPPTAAGRPAMDGKPNRCLSEKMARQSKPVRFQGQPHYKHSQPIFLVRTFS